MCISNMEKLQLKSTLLKTSASYVHAIFKSPDNMLHKLINIHVHDSIVGGVAQW